MKKQSNKIADETTSGISRRNFIKSAAGDSVVLASASTLPIDISATEKKDIPGPAILLMRPCLAVAVNLAISENVIKYRGENSWLYLKLKAGLWPRAKIKNMISKCGAGSFRSRIIGNCSRSGKAYAILTSMPREMTLAVR